MKLCLSCHQAFACDEWTCPACGFHPLQEDQCLSFAPELAIDNEGFHPDYFEQLLELEAQHFWFTSRNQLIIWAINSYFSKTNNFLEIGCGTGFVLEAIENHFSELTLSGSEIFTKGLELAQKRLPKVTFFQMDARKIPFFEEFDVIGAFDVLEHIEEDEIVLKEMFQACKPGGGIVITVPQHRFLWSIVDEKAFHKRRYSRDELVSKVKQAGFQVLQTTSFISLLLPLMILSRFKRNNNQNFDELAEYKISPLVNKILSLILSFERFVISRGFYFPLGGSLLLVAFKNP